MKVIALADGFYGGGRRRKGTEFEVKDGAKAAWFAPVEQPAAEKPAAGKPKAKKATSAKAETEAESENSADEDLVG